jgi:hypothetical protein
MERVGTLIHKLAEQFEQQQDAGKLLMTVQMLMAELQQKQVSSNIGKVSVTMPSITVVTESLPTPIEVIEAKPALPKPVPKKEEHTGWLFDPVVTTFPTLAQHQLAEEPKPALLNEVKEVFELKDTLPAGDNSANFNETLREEKTEVAAILQGTPVKDLRKAIGINDRYLFINELFRGDEDMYERSIKTINAFSIFPEAEYWIQREMKVKLGWLDDNEAVKIFDQLVKRRFS